MAEYEYLYCNTVKTKLQERIKARFSVTIRDDTLIITIKRYGEKDFEYHEQNIPAKIYTGYSIDKIVNDCIAVYRKRVYKFYFY